MDTTMGTILPEFSRRRLLLARAVLSILLIGLLAGGPKICPCPACDWVGNRGLKRLPGTFGRVLCDRCAGDGFLSGVQWLTAAAGGRLQKSAFITVTLFEELPPDWPSFPKELASRFSESKGNVTLFWPSPPTLTLSTWGVLATAQMAAILAIAIFAPLWRCAACRPGKGRGVPTPACLSCRGAGALSSFRRWVPGPWRLRLRRAGKILLVGVPLLGTLCLAAQIPYRPCHRCPEIWRENREASDVIRGCPRCGDVRKIGLWNALFLSDE
jgi:hypothetical protein